MLREFVADCTPLSRLPPGDALSRLALLSFLAVPRFNNRGMLPALRAAYAAHITDLDASSAEDAKPAPISHTLLGVAGGLRSNIAANTWTEGDLHSSVVLLSRLPPGDALSRLTLLSFLAVPQWREFAAHCARNLQAQLGPLSDRRKELLLAAWLLFALAVLAEPSLRAAADLPFRHLAEDGEAVRRTLPYEASQTVAPLARRLVSSISAHGPPRSGAASPLPRSGTASPLPGAAANGAVSLSAAAAAASDSAARGAALPLLPRTEELRWGGADPPPNRTVGSYASREEYIRTHFSLLREDFVRPLRDAIGTVRRGEALLRESEAARGREEASSTCLGLNRLRRAR